MSGLEIISLVVSIVALIAAVLNVSMIIARAKKEREEKRLQYLSEQRLHRPILPELEKKSKQAFYAKLAAYGIHLQRPPGIDAEIREMREAFVAEQTERKTPEEIKRSLQICATGISEIGEQCSYTGKGFDIKLTRDALAYIEFLERSEREFAEQWYDLNEIRCERCIHNDDCNAPGAWGEAGEINIPREKCIEGVIAFKRKEWEARE